MTVDEFRRFVLSIDGVTEQSHHGKPDFRVNGKIALSLEEFESTITIKLDLSDQAALMARTDPAFTLPGGWAKHGWTTISLVLADHDELVELISEAVDNTRSGAKPKTVNRSQPSKPRPPK